MNTWICRILAVLFFINTLPVEAFAKKKINAPRFNQEALTQKVENAVSEENKFKQEKAELEAYLAQKDLSPRERDFANLELEIVNLNLEWINEISKDSTPYDDINTRIARLYTKRIDDLKAREAVLEKLEALNDFYQSANSLTWVGAGTAALHNEATQLHSDAVRQDEAFHQEKQKIHEDKQRLMGHYTNPTDAITTGRTEYRLSPDQMAQQQSQILDLWEQDKITMEDLIEYLDPINGKPFATHAADTSDAAELLYIFFLSYNSNTVALDSETKTHALWMAKRLKARVLHLLNTQTFGFIEARSHLALLLEQVDVFLKQNYTETEQEKADDRNRPGYDMITKELNAGLQTYSNWKVGNVTQSLYNEIVKHIESKPSQDSASYEQLRVNLSVLVHHLIAVNNLPKLTYLLTKINKDGNELNGYYSALVIEYFGALYNVLLTIPTSHEQQVWFKQLLSVAAAPQGTVDNTKITNAANVRVQALALAAMLREASEGKTYTPYEGSKITDMPYLKKGIFNEQNFRQTMAAYAVDLYAPTRPINVSKHYTNLSTPVQEYGLGRGDELAQFSQYLSSIFGAFLPVQEPEMKTERVTEGLRRGCERRRYTGKLRMMQRAELLRTKNPSQHLQVYGVDKEGKAYTQDEAKCSREQSIMRFGNTGITVVVTDSEGNMMAMENTLPDNRYLKFEAIASDIMWEAFTWYLWGAAFKAVGYAWKAGKVALIAGRSAVKASKGFKLARFESKFSQVWKYSTGAWQKEMGVMSITKQGKGMLQRLSIRQSQGGEYFIVDVAREGFQNQTLKIAAEGIAPRTLKGRVLLNRAIQRELRGISARSAQTAAKGSAKATSKAGQAVERTSQTSFGKTLSKVEQSALQDEQAVVQATRKELATGRSFTVVETPAGRVVTPANSKLVSPTGGLPSNFKLDPATNNIFNGQTGEYVGTVLAEGEQATQVAHNVAQGMILGGTPVPSRIVASYLGSRYPIVKDMVGITKLMIAFQIADPYVYQLYTKPYNENFAKEQDAYFSKKHQLDQSSKQEEAEEIDDSNYLAKVQGVHPDENDSSWAAFSGMFLAVNQGLNYILPDWAQRGRRWLFKKTEQIIEAVDGPVKGLFPGNVGEALPTPAQIILMPGVLIGDPSPVVEDGSAADAQYSMAAHNQNVKKAMDGHDAKEIKAANDKEIKAIKKEMQNFLKNEDIKAFLKALPNGETQMKTVYNAYIKALEASSALAPTDLKKAQEMVENAFKAFIKQKADILTSGIKAFLVTEKAQTLKDQTEIFEQNFPNYFSKEKKFQDKMTKIINNFYEEREQALVAFYTADREALDSKKDPTALQNAAQERIDKARKTVEDELNALNNEISRAFFETVLNREIANLGANENELNSLKAYLSDPNIAAFVGALPDGEKNMKVVYKTYEQALKQAKKALDTDPSEAITIASEAKTKFLNSRVDIICQGIQAYAAQAQAQMLEQNVNLIEQDFGIFFTDDDKTQSTQLITQYWSQFVTNITKLYSLEANETLSDEEIQKAQKDILLDIKEEDTKLNNGLQTIQEGVLQRVESYSRTIAKPAAHGAIL